MLGSYAMSSESYPMPSGSYAMSSGSNHCCYNNPEFRLNAGFTDAAPLWSVKRGCLVSEFSRRPLRQCNLIELDGFQLGSSVEPWAPFFSCPVVLVMKSTKYSPCPSPFLLSRPLVLNQRTPPQPASNGISILSGLISRRIAFRSCV